MSKTKRGTLTKDARRHADKLLAAFAISLIALGTLVFSALESWSWVDSIYFSVVAVTTVGFGDLAPTTDASKLFTVVYVLLGISLISVWLNERLRRHGMKLASRTQDDDD